MSGDLKSLHRMFLTNKNLQNLCCWACGKNISQSVIFCLRSFTINLSKSHSHTSCYTIKSHIISYKTIKEVLTIGSTSKVLRDYRNRLCNRFHNFRCETCSARPLSQSEKSCHRSNTKCLCKATMWDLNQKFSKRLALDLQ